MFQNASVPFVTEAKKNKIIVLKKGYVEELPLSRQELQLKAELWLALNFDHILLNSLTPTIEQRLKHQYSQSLQQPFVSSDLDLAWSVAFEQYLKEQARKIGLFGFKVATKMLWHAEGRQ